jgi:hypothetical protein
MMPVIVSSVSPTPLSQGLREAAWVPPLLTPSI